MGIKFRVFKFRENFFSRVFNFAIFLQSRKTRNQRPAKLSTNKIVGVFLANQKARNAIVGAENLLNTAVSRKVVRQNRTRQYRKAGSWSLVEVLGVSAT